MIENNLLVDQNQPSYYVGIGASAGGLEALEAFFKTMPSTTGMCFIVVQHLSPDYKSLMNELLARHTQMPIHIIENGIQTKANHIYLIPPRMNLSIYHGKLYLEEQDSRQKLNLPIDVFFRSLAIDQQKKAIGIILSGTGSDGTIGVRDIKDAGGILLAQDEYSAKFDGMPQSAISTGVVDAILPADKMAAFLLEYITHPFNKKKNSDLTEELDSLSKILMILRDSSGVDFSYYKESTIVRRIERRVQLNRFSSLDEYIPFLSESQKEKDTLYRELLIGVTSFFRDPEAFNQLKEKVLPSLDYKKGNLRIWSAACSTGEEVYSIAIMIREYLETNRIDCDVKIFATDIDRNALDLAGKGIYPEGISADIDGKLLYKYFTKKDASFEIKDSIRNMVVFARHNVLKDPPFSKLDLLICRNLFIYFKPELQQKVLNMFYYSLNNDGYLFMGSSESIGEMGDGFTAIDTKWKIYKQKEGLKVDLFKGFHMNRSSFSTNRQPISVQTGNMERLKTEKLLKHFLSKNIPPSVILDDHHNIIEVINDMSPFLKIKPGRFSSNLFANLPSELSLFANNILRRLKTEHDEVVFERIKGIDDFNDKTIRLKGQKLEFDHQKFFLLSFEYEAVALKSGDILNQSVVDIEQEINERVKQLEQELMISKESLQAIVEELETSNEELQSSNEELIASNEELQSTNEELQSVNEELYSVNTEYQMKIDELVRLNNDLSNLLKNTEIGALYLDKKLCIRKTNLKVSEITNIMESDIGRPISHITVMDRYTDFIDDINMVVETLIGIDKEFTDSKGRTWLARIRPYRSEYNAVDGIIVTFVEISNLKEKEMALTQINDRLDSAMRFGNIAWWEWDIASGKVIYDDKKATMIGYKADEFPNAVTGINALIHPEDYDKTMHAMKLHLAGETDSWSVTYRIKRKDGSYGWYHDRGKVTRKNRNGDPVLMVGTVIDVSAIKEMEAEILERRKMLNSLIESSPVAMVQLDSNGYILSTNVLAENRYGIRPKKLFTHSCLLVNDQEDPLGESDLPFLTIKKSLQPFESTYFMQMKNQETLKKVTISGIPLYARNGSFDGALIYIT